MYAKRIVQFRHLLGFFIIWLCVGNVLASVQKQVLTPCQDDEVVDLITTYAGGNSDVEYHWYLVEYNGEKFNPFKALSESGSQITVTADADALYICEIVSPQRTTSQNLMKNGDFEDTNGATDGNTNINPPYFTSSYRFAGWAVAQPSDYENRYTMSHNAQNYYNGFLPITPHGGKWFALFDASTNGFAWKASTTDNNPDLKIEQGKEYVFSYWVANPNNNDNPTARLQFYIEYKDAQNNTKSDNIGTIYDIKKAKNKGWVQQTVVWTAPVTSNEVAIAVRDLEVSSEGNDFCLDDIIFQETIAVQQTVLHTDTFEISPQICCSDSIVESESLTICSNELPYTWHNILFTAAADSVIENYDERDCLLSRYTYRLTVRQGVEMYAKWTDVIFVRNIDSLYTAYQWYQNGQPIDGATEQFYHDPNGLTGRYHCVMQTRNGGSEETCPAAFQDLDRSAEHNPGDAPKQLVAQRTYNIGAHLQIIVSVFDDNSTTAEKYWKE